MKLWPVEHFWLTFFPDHCWLVLIWKKRAKSVQLVRVSFFRSDFLQNPYFSSNLEQYILKVLLNSQIMKSHNFNQIRVNVQFYYQRFRILINMRFIRVPIYSSFFAHWLIHLVCGRCTSNYDPGGQVNVMIDIDIHLKSIDCKSNHYANNHADRENRNFLQHLRFFFLYFALNDLTKEN